GEHGAGGSRAVVFKPARPVPTPCPYVVLTPCPPLHYVERGDFAGGREMDRSEPRVGGHEGELTEGAVDFREGRRHQGNVAGRTSRTRRAIFHAPPIRSSHTSSVARLSHQVTNTRAQRPTLVIDMRDGGTPFAGSHAASSGGGAAAIQVRSERGAGQRAATLPTVKCSKTAGQRWARSSE